MLGRLALAIVVGVVAFLACELLGALLVAIKVEFVVAIGSFLKEWSGVIGLLAAVWHFFAGGNLLRK